MDLTTQNLEIPRTLLQLTSNLEREQFAQNVLRILEAKGRALDFLLYLIKADVDAINESAVLFRVNTVGTKGQPPSLLMIFACTLRVLNASSSSFSPLCHAAVVEYMKMVGQSYISNTLHPPLHSIIQSGVKLDDK